MNLSVLLRTLPAAVLLLVGGVASGQSAEVRERERKTENPPHASVTEGTVLLLDRTSLGPSGESNVWIGQMEPEPPAPQSLARTCIGGVQRRTGPELSDAQIAEARKLLQALNTSLRAAQARLIKLSAEIDELSRTDGDLVLIRARLDEEAKIRADARYQDLVAQRALRKIERQAASAPPAAAGIR